MASLEVSGSVTVAAVRIDKHRSSATGTRLGVQGANLDRRLLLTATAKGITALSAAWLVPTYSAQASATDEIRPFQINFPEEALVDLRRRIAATMWPKVETVAGASQGVRLATMQKVARYWQTEYDWRKTEARLNALPQFVTNIDGLDIHFIHVRSKHEHALPIIVTHGWPGSIIEQLKIIDPLTNPTANGASASDAFDLVIPSLPGYGFSGKPIAPGWDIARIARAWVTLMKRLGYTRFVAAGGDVGAQVVERIRRAGTSRSARHSLEYARYGSRRRFQALTAHKPPPPKVPPSRLRSVPFPMKFTRRRAIGPRRRTPSSFFTTSLPKVGTSQRGSSRCYIQRTFVRG
jgi:pimeloyl-ACP methyl ester carboxylesterase